MDKQEIVEFVPSVSLVIHRWKVYPSETIFYVTGSTLNTYPNSYFVFWMESVRN